MRAQRARHRVRQFFMALGAASTADDEAYVARILAQAAAPAMLLRLFETMARAERHHGIEVCRILERQGYTDPDLCIAALLHDAGKAAAPPRLWERVLVVLVAHLAPRRAEAWGNASDGDQPMPRGMRRAFVVRYHHALWGARRAEEAGALLRAVALIRHHHDAPPVGGGEAALDLDLLAALQAADEA